MYFCMFVHIRIHVCMCIIINTYLHVSLSIQTVACSCEHVNVA
jgi:hypothetical protein